MFYRHQLSIVQRSILHHLEQLAPMEILRPDLVIYPQTDQYRAGDAACQTYPIKKSELAIFQEVAPGDPEIGLEHGLSFGCANFPPIKCRVDKSLLISEIRGLCHPACPLMIQ